MTVQRHRSLSVRCRRIVLRGVLRGSNLGYVSRMPIDVLADLDGTARFSTPDTCRMARVSFRQLDYWTRLEIVKPDTPAKGSGSQRRFTGAQVRDVAMVGRLRELGVSLDAIEEVLVAVRDAEGALIVIAPEFVRVVQPGGLADAIVEANGAAIVVSPDALQILSADVREADRCASDRRRSREAGRPLDSTG